MKDAGILLAAVLSVSAPSCQASAGNDWCAFTKKVVADAPNSFVHFKGPAVKATVVSDPTKPDFLGTSRPNKKFTCEVSSATLLGGHGSHASYTCSLTKPCANQKCNDAAYKTVSQEYRSISQQVRSCFPTAKFSEKRNGTEETRDTEWDLDGLLPEGGIWVRLYDSGKDDDGIRKGFYGMAPTNESHFNLWVYVWNASKLP